jgi:hypothetical protein
LAILPHRQNPLRPRACGHDIAVVFLDHRGNQLTPNWL